MVPFSFLQEECRSVRATLNETLRHDYGPERSEPFFDECRSRLEFVEQAIVDDPQMDRDTIATHMRTLGSLGSRISLIERSHLGEFSWPFSDVIEKVAEKMLVEKSVDGDKAPIVHVIAEGMDYQIVDDEVPLQGLRRIIIVAFPRQLKHYVLLHAIFGHELAHVAINADIPGAIIKSEVMPVLREGILQDTIQLKQWLKRNDAPERIRQKLSADPNFEFTETSLENWRQEVLCDLFGLMLFGPAFVAAHRTIIETICKRPDSFDFEKSTHPPYIIRQRILAKALHHLGWDQPVLPSGDGPLEEAEHAMLRYVTASREDSWSAILSDDQMGRLISGLKKVFSPHDFVYVPPSEQALREFVGRLSHERPPIWQSIDGTGKPDNRVVPASHYLYAGWTYWFGRGSISAEASKSDPSLIEPTFLEINRLCDHALLQQKAIEMIQGHNK